MSYFKMFERAPYELHDPIAFTELIVSGIRGEEKIYGPIFTARIIKYVLHLISRQSGEDPPENIKTLDQMTKYLFSKKDKISVPPCYAVIWAQFVTQKKLEGHLGAGERVMDLNIFKWVMESSSGEVRKVDSNKNIDNVLPELRRPLVNLKIAPLEMGYKKNEDGSIDMLYRDCYLQDGCKFTLDAGLSKRPDGRQVCGFSAYVCQYLKMASGHEWDYTVLEFEKPNCIAKCFMV